MVGDGKRNQMVFGADESCRYLLVQILRESKNYQLIRDFLRAGGNTKGERLMTEQMKLYRKAKCLVLIGKVLIFFGAKRKGFEFVVQAAPLLMKVMLLKIEAAKRSDGTIDIDALKKDKVSDL
jgi:hypothetical protein